MSPNSQQPKGRDSTLSRLNLAIDGLNPASDVSSVAPVQAVCSSSYALLTTIKVFALICRSELLAYVSPELHGQRR